MNLAILGSTGTIGKNTLDIVSSNPEKLNVFALSAGDNFEIISVQIKKFSPKVVSLSNPESAKKLESLISSFDKKPEILSGPEASSEISRMSEVDCIMAGIVGFDGLSSVFSALEAGKKIALANKESLVAAGSLVRKKAEETGAKVVPVDSEHSSLYQLLKKDCAKPISKLSITASGGPFLNKAAEDFANISAADAIKHPKWKMGPKISVDSATLMNKGLEVIEAAYLFDLKASEIEVLVHPQSIVHGLIEYTDGTIEANMYQTDMRVPISVALSELGEFELESKVEKLDLAAVGKLEFSKPDTNKFPCLSLAYDALSLGPRACVCLNAANEVAVNAFLAEKIRFTDIYEVCNKVLGHSTKCSDIMDLSEIKYADANARVIASEILQTI